MISALLKSECALNESAVVYIQVLPATQLHIFFVDLVSASLLANNAMDAWIVPMEVMK
jgi:hypothetical protein